MTIRNDLADAVGNTPLIRLRGASEATGCEILGKCEFLNPGQSVKDRAALYIIRVAADVERRSVLHRLAGVEELALAEDLAARRLARSAQAHKRRVAHRVGQVVPDGHGRLLLSSRRQRTQSPPAAGVNAARACGFTRPRVTHTPRQALAPRPALLGGTYSRRRRPTGPPHRRRNI